MPQGLAVVPLKVSYDFSHVAKKRHFRKGQGMFEVFGESHLESLKRGRGHGITRQENEGMIWMACYQEVRYPCSRPGP